ncbi:hypothetical protein MSPP1_002737 [Malassezia sp. CBS 17886]|nr:hypothetical protein MSPP1_002737 [Malassezia sp. CBS 17886]
MAPREEVEGHNEPPVDYVLKFDAFPPTEGKAKRGPTPAQRGERATELARLIDAVRSVGLATATRWAPDNSGALYVFVSASAQKLEEMYAHERYRDFMFGVASAHGLGYPLAIESRGAVTTSTGAIVSPADRVRYVHELVTGPRESAGVGCVPGAGVEPRSAAYPHLVDMMPLHDAEFNRAWLSSWASVTMRSVLLGVGDEELESLRCHLGEKVALYFAFLNTYFLALAPAAALGLVFWIFGETYSGGYSTMLAIWACVFVEVWRLRERKLAVRWGTTGLSQAPQRRASFRPRAVVADAATGEKREVYEWWRRELRMLVTIPVMVVFVAVLVATLTTLFMVEIVAEEVYEGPGQAIVPLIPTILFSTCVPLILSAWQATATALTNFENHAADSTYSNSLTTKIFGMQSLVTYGGVILTAFVYIPFGERYVQYLFDRGYLTEAFRVISRQPNFEMPKMLNFTVRPGRLYDQLFALCVTGQIMNTVTEVVVPIALRVLGSWRSVAGSRYLHFWRRKAPNAARVSFATDAIERNFLDRVQSEFALPAYDIFVDYAEMATQFGSITLWSAIWPLAPVMAYVNNWFELRSDSFKLIVNMRRPVPVRTETIGRWLEVLAFLVRLAVFTNASLVYLFEDRLDATSQVVSTAMRIHVDKGSGGPSKPTCISTPFIATIFPAFLLPRTSNGAALLASFLVAIMCEQMYLIAHTMVQHLLVRIMWRGSEEETAIRHMQWENRKSIADRLERVNRADSAQAARTGNMAAARARIHPDLSFWDPSHNVAPADLFADKTH